MQRCPNHNFAYSFLPRKALMLALLCAGCMLAVGCGEEASVTTSNNSQQEEDAGSGDAGWDVSEGDETAFSGRQLCAGAGTMSGGGYSLSTCTAPVDQSGVEMTGAGYRLQSGVTRYVVPSQ